MKILGKVIATIRFVLFAILSIVCGLLLLLGRIFGNQPRYSFFIFRSSVAMLKAVLGIRVTFFGKVPDQLGVIICNHRSYIDVILIPSKTPYVVVAKSQVSKWPIIGQVSLALRVIFVNRDSIQSRRETRKAIRQRLSEGLSVLIYPEGTTYAGPGVIDFKPGMFNSCAEEGITILPIALEYKDKDMAWIGADTFVPHFFRAFAHPVIRVAVSFGPAMNDTDTHRLRHAAQEWVHAETIRLRHWWDEGAVK